MINLILRMQEGIHGQVFPISHGKEMQGQMLAHRCFSISSQEQLWESKMVKGRRRLKASHEKSWVRLWWKGKEGKW